MKKKTTHPQQQKLRKKTKRDLEGNRYFGLQEGDPKSYGEAKKKYKNK